MSEGKDQMKAIGQEKYGDVSVLKEVTVPKPKATGRDIVVKVMSVATNPVDVKKRNNFGNAEAKLEQLMIVGWDASGVVEEVGPDCKLFKVGDHVMFAGVLTRQGCHAEYCAVDERIVGRKPKSLTWDQAATVPLVTLTAWEGLIEGMGIPIPKTEEEIKAHQAKSILVIGGAGGVGSTVTQISKNVLKLGKVIATASREETVKWCKEHGADLTIDHSKPLADQLKELGVSGVDYIYDCVDLFIHFSQLADITNPCGKICSITGLQVDPSSLFMKRITLVPEVMFARAIFNCEPEKQGQLLNDAADLIDKGVLKHTMTVHYSAFTLENVVAAHKLQESGKAIGKIGITVREDK